MVVHAAGHVARSPVHFVRECMRVFFALGMFGGSPEYCTAHALFHSSISESIKVSVRSRISISMLVAVENAVQQTPVQLKYK